MSLSLTQYRALRYSLRYSLQNACEASLIKQAKRCLLKAKAAGYRAYALLQPGNARQRRRWNAHYRAKCRWLAKFHVLMGRIQRPSPSDL